MEIKEEKTNYRNRRKTFHFSQKNDDLLQYLNSKETKDQSAFIMRLIREAMEKEGKPDPLQSLQEQLNQALAEIKRLKESLTNTISTPVESINTNIDGMDDEIINRLFVMLADIKHSNEQNFNDMKNLLKGVNIDVKGINMDVVKAEEQSEDLQELSDEEFDNLFDDDLDFQ